MTTTKPFKPMLAGTSNDPRVIVWPILCSPKLDGIRVLIHPTLGPVTRSLKPVPNDFIREALSDPLLHGLDGEVIIGQQGVADQFNSTQSGVMRVTGAPDFYYVVFDSFTYPKEEYTDRFADAELTVASLTGPLASRVVMVESKPVTNYVDMEEFNDDKLAEGYEGIMYRYPSGPYKFGRSTEKEGTLVKVKPFADSEARIVGFEFIQRNHNVATKNALGRTERSTHKANKVADEFQIGAFKVIAINGPHKGSEFSVGTGMTEAQRRDFAFRQAELIGDVLTYAYQDQPGSMPRFPIFKGLRSDYSID